jgi:uncharacterized protein
MEMTTNALNWFEIPVNDFARAKAFYSAIFDYDMPEMDMGPRKMGFLLHERGVGVGGAIVAGGGLTASDGGTLVYLTGGSDLATVLDRVAAAGGSVVTPKMLIAPGMGFFGVFRDSEGNRLGLHSMG